MKRRLPPVGWARWAGIIGAFCGLLVANSPAMAQFAISIGPVTPQTPADPNAPPPSTRCPMTAPGPADLANDQFIRLGRTAISYLFLDVDRIECRGRLVRVTQLRPINPAPAPGVPLVVYEEELDYDCASLTIYAVTSAGRDSAGVRKMFPNLFGGPVVSGSEAAAGLDWACGKAPRAGYGDLYRGEAAVIADGRRRLAADEAAKPKLFTSSYHPMVSYLPQADLDLWAAQIVDVSPDHVRLGGGPQGERTVGIGDEVLPGWTLARLTATMGFIKRGDEWQAFGLNPESRLKVAARGGQGAPPRLWLTKDIQAVADLDDQAVLAKMTPEEALDYAVRRFPGLDEQEGRRYQIYLKRLALLVAPMRAAYTANYQAASAVDSLGASGWTRPIDYAAVLGPGYVELFMRTRMAEYQERLARYEAARAAGIGILRIAAGKGLGSAAPYQSVLSVIEIDYAGSIYQLTRPEHPTPPGEDAPPAIRPELTQAMVDRLTDADGQPLTPRIKAIILAANAEEREADRIAAARAMVGGNIPTMSPFAPWHGLGGEETLAAVIARKP